ncbi:DUF1983 domain-containing protein [Rhizobium sp. LCM 4573]|uniref:phage tail tip fiber protein n=1 Tax=Rhizobium sp. LCM 4573 TaxID=1848291 RepID=UPI0008DB32E2|nr:DUF1983 domain-containing protein [Rhizobium sp. LCM 4573]OHV81603.1 hypothetical protein LCM4573_21195 [Rhizobium sp. LCM 4573]
MAIFSAIGSAIAGALFTSAASIALATKVIAGVLAFGAQLGLSYLNRPKKRKYAAVQGETQYGGDVPVGTLFGAGKAKGQRSYYAKFGSGNKFNSEVFLLANGWCDGLEPYVYFYGKKHNLVARPIIGNEVAHYGVEGFVSDGAHFFSIRFYDGRPGQGVDQKLVNDTAALGQTWKATSVNAGICYVVVERRYSSSLFKNGKPDIEFVLRGLREYDPRKDSTVAGGSGPQRLNDPATWAHTKNPAVHRLNYQLGLRALVSGRTLIGEGKSLGQLDLGTYFASMNVCDSLRSDGKRRYECSLWVNGDDDHTEILKEFDDAMAGYGINRRGLSGVISGAPQIPVLEVTPADIPMERAKEVQYRKSAFERFNHLSGQFTSIEAMWNPESLKPVYVNADIAADGRNRQATNDFLQVTDPDIAQYLLNIRYRQNRKGGTATLPVSRRVGMRVQEGEWITWRGRTWMISEWAADERFRITLKLSETGADIYDDHNIDPGPIVIPPTPPVNPSLLSTIQNFNVEAGLVEGAEGYQVPALEFTWTPPDDPSIIAVRFFYQIEGTTELFEDQSTDPESGIHRTMKDVVSGVRYVARATITTVPDRLKTYTPWVTTDDPTGFFTSPYAGVIGFEQLGQDLKEYQDWIGSGLRDIEETLAELDARVADQEFGNSYERQQLREQLKVTYDTVTAEYERRVEVLAEADHALALRIESLSAEIFDPETGLPAVATAVSALKVEVEEVDGLVTAIADSVLELDSTVDRFSAEGKFRVTTEATPSGALARIGMSVAASGSGQTSSASIFLDAIAGGLSRVAINADQFVVIAGNDVRRPFVVQGGSIFANELFVNWAKITDVQIGWADIQDAVVNNLQVTNANIVNLTIGTEKLQISAITFGGVINGSYGGQATNGWYVMGELGADNPNPAPVMIDVAGSMNGQTPGQGSVQIEWRLINITTNDVIHQETLQIGTNGSASRNIERFRIGINNAQGWNVYEAQVRVTGAPIAVAASANCRFVLWKR